MIYDVVIIGAGVSGAAIARELSRYEAEICVLEKEEDVCCGTSKANSAIVHAGYDCKQGTMMARMNLRGNEMSSSPRSLIFRSAGTDPSLSVWMKPVWRR